MKDFIKGTLGKFLQVILAIVGAIFFVVSLVACGSGEIVGGGIFMALSILSFCAIFGIRYWLGHIIRTR